jgi:hypothetical protein
MKRILGSLFVIMAIVGIGVFTTGAYFTSTVSTSNQVFTTSTAGLKFGQCGVIGSDCSGVAATFTTLDMTNLPTPSGQLTGPGIQNEGCMVIENTGPYDMTLSTVISFTTSNTDFGVYFQLAADQANSSCYVTGALMPWTPATTAQSNSPLAFGTLAHGQRLYAILYNRWNSAGVNQDYLKGQWLNLTLQVTGQTV